MSDEAGWDVTFVEKNITYYIELKGNLVVVQDVPARVNLETGERMYSPETVEHLQALIRNPQRSGSRARCLMPIDSAI